MASSNCQFVIISYHSLNSCNTCNKTDLGKLLKRLNKALSEATCHPSLIGNDFFLCQTDEPFSMFLHSFRSNLKKNKLQLNKKLTWVKIC